FQAFGDARPARSPVAALITPAIAGLAGLAAVRLVPLGLELVAGLVVATGLLELALVLEGRLLARPSGATSQDRTSIVGLGLVSAFLVFTGVASLVPGGLDQAADAGAGLARPSEPLAEASILILAVADAAVAFLLGYRFVALRGGHLRPAATVALGYAAAIAIGAGLVRAAALPRLLGPALLTLVLFLWDAVRGSSPATRRDPRFLWEVGLLAALGVVVVAWNIGLRG
ncbi:MAG TPA: hypothetical protein VIV06_10205, partial [Candidatus Limnocylindrales bacterium]